MDKLHNLREQFDQLPIRTRLIITFASILLLFMIFELAWYSGTDARNQQVKKQIESVDQQILDIATMQEEMNKGIYNQRNNPKQARLATLEKQIDEVQSELEKKTRSLVRPQAMAGLLKEIIDNSQKLKLLSLEKQAPQPLFETNEENGQANQVQMYRHPVVMIFEGSYSDTQKFLEKLEAMQRKVNFEQFEFSVEEYPKSKVTLVVSTFSMSRKWIGG